MMREALSTITPAGLRVQLFRRARPDPAVTAINPRRVAPGGRGASLRSARVSTRTGAGVVQRYDGTTSGPFDAVGYRMLSVELVTGEGCSDQLVGPP
jgi:hypothetical protein